MLEKSPTAATLTTPATVALVSVVIPAWNEAETMPELLGRIRAALVDVPASERSGDVPVAREYRRRDERPHPWTVRVGYGHTVTSSLARGW